MSGFDLSVTHRSMTAVDGRSSIGSHHQGHHIRSNFCLVSCCTVSVVYWDASELCYTWSELKSFHTMSTSPSMLCPSLLHKSHERRGTSLFHQSDQALLKSPALLWWNFLYFLMHFEDGPYMSWEETFWVFNLSLRHDVLESHKETTSNHLIVMNSIHMQPLGCWCISKACFGLLLSPHCFLNPVIQAWGKRRWRQSCFPPQLVCKTLTLSPLCFHYGASIFLWAFHFWHCSPHSLQTADSPPTPHPLQAQYGSPTLNIYVLTTFTKVNLSTVLSYQYFVWVLPYFQVVTVVVYTKRHFSKNLDDTFDLKKINKREKKCINNEIHV